LEHALHGRKNLQAKPFWMVSGLDPEGIYRGKKCQPTLASILDYSRMTGTQIA
jgi:hypothetical protein